MYARIQFLFLTQNTFIYYLIHRRIFLVSHKTKDRKDDEPRIKTCQTVYYWNQKGVPEINHKAIAKLN